MEKRSFCVFSVALAGAALAVSLLGLGRPAFAAESGASSDERAPARLAPKKQAAAPARAAAANVEDPYRCHPMEDIACTVVRETLQGTLIVTLRSGSEGSLAPAWTIISGTPPTPGPHPGGTVYVVPSLNATEVAAGAHQAALMPANGAPILE